MTVHTLTIDGIECAGVEGQTVLDIARESGVDKFLLDVVN